jgi:homeobox protein 2
VGEKNYSANIYYRFTLIRNPQFEDHIPIAKSELFLCLLFSVQDGFPISRRFSKSEYPQFFTGMHKKSMETTVVQPKGKSDVPQQPAIQRGEKCDVEEKRLEGKSPISKEELRENSIAALRAKAQEHSAKVLGTVTCERPESKVERQATEEKSSGPLSPVEEPKSP